MNSRVIVLSAAILFSLTGYSLAYEGMNHEEHADAMAADQAQAEITSAAVEVGNTICPVSGDKIKVGGKMGDPVKYEYNGKIYNLCCPMCKKDFKKDPEKYSKIAEEQAAKAKSGE